jgi:flagellar biosynthetic protein FliP
MRRAHAFVAVVVVVVLSSLGAGPPADRAKTDSALKSTGFQINRPIRDVETQKKKVAPARTALPAPAPTPVQAPGRSNEAQAPAAESPDLLALNPKEVVRSVTTVGLFALVSLAPTALLMLTAFVRINVVLVLLRQALGSPQVPGNPVLTALALLLTALVMRPVGETVYHASIEPYSQGKLTWVQAYDKASRPVKAFMIEQIKRTGHENYVWAIHDEVTPAGRPAPVYEDDFSLGVVATSFLLSELTTALVIGFYLYLPFLVVDLVVSAVLASMGLFMLPPSLVSTPLKLILFVLVNGWVHVATMLLQSFGPVAGGG